MSSGYVRACLSSFRTSGRPVFPELSARLAAEGSTLGSPWSGSPSWTFTPPPSDLTPFQATSGFNCLTASAKSIASVSSSDTTRLAAR